MDKFDQLYKLELELKNEKTEFKRKRKNHSVDHIISYELRDT